MAVVGASRDPERWDRALRWHLRFQKAEALISLMERPEGRLRALIALTRSRLRVQSGREDCPSGAAIEDLLLAVDPRYYAEEWVSALDLLVALGEPERARNLWRQCLDRCSPDFLAPLLLAYEHVDPTDARRRWARVAQDSHQPRFLQAAAWAAEARFRVIDRRKHPDTDTLQHLKILARHRPFRRSLYKQEIDLKLHDWESRELPPPEPAWEEASRILREPRTSPSDLIKGAALVSEQQEHTPLHVHPNTVWNLLLEEARTSRQDFAIGPAVMSAVDTLIRSARFDRVADLLDIVNNKDLDQAALALIYKHLQLDEEENASIAPETARRLAKREKPGWGLGFAWRVERQMAHRIPGSKIPWKSWTESKVFAEKGHSKSRRITVRARAWLRLAEEARAAGEQDLAIAWRTRASRLARTPGILPCDAVELHREIGLYAARRNNWDEALVHLDAIEGDELFAVQARDLIRTALVEAIAGRIGRGDAAIPAIGFTETQVEAQAPGLLRWAKHRSWMALALHLPRSFEHVRRALEEEGARLGALQKTPFLKVLNRHRTALGLEPIAHLSSRWSTDSGIEHQPPQFKRRERLKAYVQNVKTILGRSRMYRCWSHVVGIHRDWWDINGQPVPGPAMREVVVLPGDSIKALAHPPLGRGQIALFRIGVPFLMIGLSANGGFSINGPWTIHDPIPAAAASRNSPLAAAA